MDAINLEVQHSNRGELSDQLISRIVALSQSLKPYKYFNQDNLITDFISPERGLLLSSINNSGINPISLEKIYKRGNFTFSELKDFNLTRAHLNHINLSNSNLTNTILDSAQLDFAVFSNSKMTRTRFVAANLRHCQFSNNIINCKFNGADLSNASFVGSHICYSEFIDCSLNQAKINNTEIIESYFYKTDLTVCDFVFKNLNYLDDLKNYKECAIEGTAYSSDAYALLVKNQELFEFSFDSLYVSKNSRFAANPYINKTMKRIDIDNSDATLLIKQSH